MNSNGYRTLHAIACDIHMSWPKPYFGAVPYIQAMRNLSDITDMYGMDSADSIVRYFLANAGTWRGEDARRIKGELRKMIGSK